MRLFRITSLPAAAALVAASATAATAALPAPAPVCVTADNYTHTTAGRAHQSGGYAYANGSNDALGLWNTFTVTALRQTGPGYWVRADGGC